jgi:hypothetical protein
VQSSAATGAWQCWRRGPFSSAVAADTAERGLVLVWRLQLTVGTTSAMSRSSKAANDVGLGVRVPFSHYVDPKC